MAQAHQYHSALVEHQASGDEQGRAAPKEWIENPRRHCADFGIRTREQQGDGDSEAVQDAGDVDAVVPRCYQLMSNSLNGFEIKNWSGARDLNPGPLGPEPWRRRVLARPAGSASAPLNSIAAPLLS